MTTLKELKAVAKELHKALDLEEAIKVDGVEEDVLKEVLVQVGTMIEPTDVISEKTKKILTEIGVKLPKKETVQKKSPKAPAKAKEPKEQIDPLEFNPKKKSDAINKIICDNYESFDGDMIHKELKKMKLSTSDATVKIWVKDLRKTFHYLKAQGIIK